MDQSQRVTNEGSFGGVEGAAYRLSLSVTAHRPAPAISLDDGLFIQALTLLGQPADRRVVSRREASELTMPRGVFTKSSGGERCRTEGTRGGDTGGRSEEVWRNMNPAKGQEKGYLGQIW